MNIDLSEKYKIPDGHAVAPMSTLSFILRKAEIGFNLTAAEWQWLETQQLTAAIEAIKTQEAYRQTLENEIHRELLDLRRNQYVSVRHCSMPHLSTELALVLYKIKNLEPLSPAEKRFTSPDYKSYCEFTQLKAKLAISEDIPFDATSRRILAQLCLEQKPACADLEWLRQHRAASVADRLAPHFHSLCEKYQISTATLPAEARLHAYTIIQKLEEDKLPGEDGQNFLKQNGFTDALGIAQTIEFKALKKKFSATQIEDDTPTQHLYKVLKRLDAGLPLTEPDLNFLKKRKLHETVKFALKADADRLIHKIEQGQSLHPDEVEWCKQNQFEEIIFLPLKKVFGIEHRKDALDSPLYQILQKLEAEQRLTDQEVIWLETEEWCGSGYMDFRHNKIFRAHHRLEALFCEAEFKRTKNHWLLASGSAHWRKAEQAERALSLTELDIDKIREAKLRQALLTTRGGALRDLDRLGEAERCALAAIEQYSHSHNPYTLMGALCYDTYRYAEGFQWFEEAQKRGATKKDVDAEIKRILSKKKDPSLIYFLLEKDPYRYGWVKKYARKPA